jgi:hypothetical protein
VVADAGKVLDAASTDQYDAVLLQVVADARDVGGDLSARVVAPGARQSYASDLPKRRVWLLRRNRSNNETNTALLRVALHRRRLALLGGALASFAYELANGRHCVSNPFGITYKFNIDAQDKQDFRKWTLRPAHPEHR